MKHTTMLAIIFFIITAFMKAENFIYHDILQDLKECVLYIAKTEQLIFR